MAASVRDAPAFPPSTNAAIGRGKAWGVGELEVIPGSGPGLFLRNCFSVAVTRDSRESREPDRTGWLHSTLTIPLHRNPHPAESSSPTSSTTCTTPRSLNKKMSRRGKQASNTAGIFLFSAAVAAAVITAAPNSGVAAFAFSPSGLPKGITAARGGCRSASNTLQFSRHVGGTLLGSAQRGLRAVRVERGGRSVVGVSSFSSWSGESNSSRWARSSSRSEMGRDKGSSRMSAKNSRVSARTSAAETTAEAMMVSRVSVISKS